MTGRCELRLTLAGLEVSAKLITPEGTTPFGPISVRYAEADLTRDTIETLQKWLSRWGVLSRKLPPGTLVNETFQILGRHLYELVFDGDIERALHQGLDAARRLRQRLRIRLYVTEGQFDLDRLPWEFLYYDGGAGGRRFFFARETDLHLYRSLTLDAAMPEIQLHAIRAPLRVLFVVAIEDAANTKAGGYWANIGSLRAALESLQRADLDDDEPPRLELDFAVGWDAKTLSEKLQTDPHVVHFIGHARYEDGDTEVELPGPDGRPVWVSSDEFAHRLTWGKSTSERPRLVFLHLRQRQKGDFTDSFERLAPKLVKLEIPSVIAMQYPLEDLPADTFVQEFYGALGRGIEIHVAVEQARERMITDHQSLLLLGTPVLYMQSDESRLLDLEPDLDVEPAVARVAATRAPMGAARPRAAGDAARRDEIARLLEGVVDDRARDPQDVEALVEWIRATTWTGSKEDLLNHVRLAKDRDPRRQELANVYLGLARQIERSYREGGRP